MNPKTTYTRLKTGITISVLLVCAWALSGHALWQSARGICYNYLRVQKLAHTTNNDTIIIAKNSAARELNWIKKDEVRYKGKMFDIRQKIENEESLMLIGHYDRVDDELLLVLLKLVGDDEENPGSVEDCNWVDLIAILGSSNNLSTYHCTGMISHKTPWKNRFHSTLHRGPQSPPPDVIV